ncbi:ChaN family lipoprotein [Marinobacter sp. TBZ242]|uniref:ChaN family lipoprotein n=1 Tax=Marinobacter azerbaijanicus TaxID=3050455 RepID=A0ABT7IBW9_9GAMM|nr:ChaN family lipoprotein [Marinobacter sp. TBZ242]MDL0431158.1 ChaN family lipoprotein [Marinobacter sp. TBZ242]
MTNYSHTLVMLTCLLITGCASLPASNPTTVVRPQSQYDSIITNNQGSLLSINGLANELAPADVVVIGEYHGHHGSHLLQSLVQSALYQRRPQQVLSMEQFTLNDQPELDRYLAGQSGEEELIADTNAWPNYKASYRPLIEFSRNRNLPVIAANAPADIVRCVGRKGASYLETLDTAQRQQLPDDPFVDTSAYRKKFSDALGSGHGGDHGGSDGKMTNSTRLENSYKAQLLRDNTMADQVIRALKKYPDHQVIHVTGTFHAEDRLGMVAVLEQKRPDLEVAVVSPVFWRAGENLDNLVEANRQKGDFLYFIQPLPEEYQDRERHRDAIAEQFRNAAELPCD